MPRPRPAPFSPPMSESSLLALSPLDGRYAGKVDALRPIFSEYGLIRARVKVEVEWLLALAAEPGIVELPAFTEGAKAKLRALADGFSVANAASSSRWRRKQRISLDDTFSVRCAASIAENRPFATVANGTPRSVCVCGSKKISAWRTPSAAARRK